MQQNNIVDQLRRFYDTDSSRYRDAQWFSSNAAQTLYWATQSLILKELQINRQHRVLEIGCGPGTWTKILLSKEVEIEAVDLSPGMIQQAREYVADQRIVFRQGDFLKLDFQVQGYDRILSVRVLEYFLDKKAVMEKCFQLLKPGGWMVFITKSTSPIWKYRGLILNLLRKIGFWQAENFMNVPAEKGYDKLFWQDLISAKEAYYLVREIGFENCRVLPVLIRLPIVSLGLSEIPILRGKAADRYLEFSRRLTDKINNNRRYQPSLSAIYFSESYAIIAQRPNI